MPLIRCAEYEATVKFGRLQLRLVRSWTEYGELEERQKDIGFMTCAQLKSAIRET